MGDGGTGGETLASRSNPTLEEVVWIRDTLVPPTSGGTAGRGSSHGLWRVLGSFITN